MAGLNVASYGRTPNVVRAPKWPALCAVGVALLAMLAAVGSYLSLGTTALILAAAGYVLGCLGAVIFASTHRALRDKERRNPAFRLDPSLDSIAKGSIAVGLLAGLVCAFQVATELAK